MRADFLRRLSARGVNAVSHYVPLHDSPAGRRFGRTSGELPVTEGIAARLIRLPLHANMKESDVDYVVEFVLQEINQRSGHIRRYSML
jgi:dTDP-4-amino-4,6-dideoxygalactose transaminase